MHPVRAGVGDHLVARGPLRHVDAHGLHDPGHVPAGHHREPDVQERVEGAGLARSVAPASPAAGRVLFLAIRGLALDQLHFPGEIDSTRDRAAIAKQLQATVDAIDGQEDKSEGTLLGDIEARRKNREAGTPSK